MRAEKQPEAELCFALQVLPLAEDAHIFFELSMAPTFGQNARAGSAQSIEMRPEYEMDLSRTHGDAGDQILLDSFGYATPGRLVGTESSLRVLGI
jgi:hypothetical protein